MAKLEEVILRGARSAQPTAGTGSGEAPAGTIMYITDEGINERVKDDHSQWESWGGVGTAYASNSNAVSAAGAGGAATNVSRADHVHLGTTSISHSSNTYSGPITLTAEGIVGITSPSSGTLAINAVASGGAAASYTYTNYTPTLSVVSGTPPTLGTGGSATGRYVQIGKVVIAYGTIVFGSSGVSAGSGQYTIALPVTAVASGLGVFGSVVLYDSSPGTFNIAATYTSSSTAVRIAFTGSALVVTEAAPWTWAANDQIIFQVRYEAA